MATETKQESAKNAETAAASVEKKSKRVASQKAKPKRRAKRKPAKATKVKMPHTAPATPAPKPRALRKQSTKAERARILAAADRDGLTALQVQKRFGVKPVTYYSWRKAGKKVGASLKPAAATQFGSIDMSGEVRKVLRTQIAMLLPGIIASEIAELLGGISTKKRR
jgi:transposase-like protein